MELPVRALVGALGSAAFEKWQSRSVFDDVRDPHAFLDATESIAK